MIFKPFRCLSKRSTAIKMNEIPKFYIFLIFIFTLTPTLDGLNLKFDKLALFTYNKYR